MTREVTLREMLEKMFTDRYRDDETFRWYQCSVPGPDGTACATEELRVTFGQARRELGIVAQGDTV